MYCIFISWIEFERICGVRRKAVRFDQDDFFIRTAAKKGCSRIVSLVAGLGKDRHNKTLSQLRTAIEKVNQRLKLYSD
jgi:hypothetical protein